jgi:hypothetical protein
MTGVTRRRNKIALGLGLALIATALFATPASAATTRAEYVGQADPICQAQQLQDRATFRAYKKSIKRYLKHHPNPDPDRPSKTVLRMAMRYYDRVLAIHRRADSELSSISPAPGDEGATAEWLQLRGASADLLERAIRAVRHNKIKPFIRLYLKSIRRSLQAEVSIRDFGFRYCSSPPDVL